MTTSTNPIELAQQLLFGKWRYSAAALRACQRGTWAEFVREAAPRRPLILGRLSYGRCVAHAAKSLSAPVRTKLMVVPLWACSTAEETSTEWVAVHGILREGEPMYVQEMGPFIAVDDASPRMDALMECDVNQWTAGTVVDAQYYAESIPLQLRSRAYGVHETRLFEVVSAEVRESAPMKRPTREVPVFATWFEPRVKVSPELEAKIRAMCITSEESE